MRKLGIHWDKQPYLKILQETAISCKILQYQICIILFLMKDEDKTKMRRLGFLPQQKPRYHVKYEVFPDRLECRTTCPKCLTAIQFVIHGQTKYWSTRYISLSIEKALNDNHTRKCLVLKNELNPETHFSDILRGNEQRLARADRVLRGKEPPNI